MKTKKQKKIKQPLILRRAELSCFINHLKNSKIFYYGNGKFQIRRLNNEFSKY